MPRRGNIAKRDVLADPVCNSKMVTRLINNIMYDGKKGVAQKIVYEAFDIVKEKTGNDPLESSKKRWKTSCPCWKSRPAVWAAPLTRCLWRCAPRAARPFGLRWLTTYSRNRSERRMSQRLAGEIMDACNGNGGACKSARIPTRWPRPTRLSRTTDIDLWRTLGGNYA